MPYIGNTPAKKYAAFDVQYFTTSATASYTLDHAVANELDIRLVINNVIQEPGSGKAYTASGTTLTLSAATAGTDTMYCVYTAKASQTVNPPAGSVGPSQIANNAVDLTSKVTGTLPTANGGTGSTSATFVNNTNTNSTLITSQTAKTSLVDADKFLISDSAASGALKYVEKQYLPSGSHVLISSQTVSSNVGEVLFADVFTSDYDQYLFQGTGMLKASSSNVRFRVSQSSTARTDSSYDWSYGVGMRSRSSTTWSNRGGPTDYAQFMESVHGNTGSFTMFMDVKNEGSNHGNFYGVMTNWTSDGLVQSSFGFTYGGGSSYNGFRIFTSDSNNFSAGTYSLYGVKTT